MSDTKYSNKFLVISRVGKHRFYENWLSRENGREFDIFLSFYRGVRPEIECDDIFVEHRPGKKVEGYFSLINDNWDLISRYEYFALMDDDLDISSMDLTKLFHISEENRFKISQASLTHDSYFTYAGLLQNKSYQFRCVNFIEMMCPVFRRDMLPALAKILSLGYESGVDLLWCNINDPKPNDFAIIDQVAVRHTEPVGLRKSDNGFVNGMRYEDHIFQLLKHFHLPWLPCVAYFAKRRDGSVVKNRFVLFLYSLKIWGAVALQKGVLMRARSILAHWKHIIFSKAKNFDIKI